MKAQYKQHLVFVRVVNYTIQNDKGIVEYQNSRRICINIIRHNSKRGIIV